MTVKYDFSELSTEQLVRKLLEEEGKQVQMDVLITVLKQTLMTRIDELNKSRD